MRGAAWLPCLLVWTPWVGSGESPPERFPPLRVPPGFEATLFASDPLIEYPSVIAIGSRPGSIFLAQDYMTGLGTEIIRRDEIRLVEDADGDGRADGTTLFAEGFNSIQGLEYADGTVYAMHAPLLTALRDTDGDGVADERRDLLEGLGLPPEENPVRLHCANGVVAGHDGWLYLALGDHGCDVRRPEGDRLVHESGAILRCRPDGRDLHVFATGLRNIYDVALDEELDVFVRDNENDGGDYMVRVYHSFFGADHGYPYLYLERPAEALAPLADLGRGSSAGGACYMETAFPPEYRGSLFFCEWGRAVVRYRRERAGGSFAPMEELEFASGAENDSYGFKPTDLVVDRDGSLFVSDWADEQRPKRGRGRIYRIRALGMPDPEPRSRPETPRSPRDWIGELDDESLHARVRAQRAIEEGGAAALAALRDALRHGRLGVRGRLHAVWVLARAGGEDAVAELLAIAGADPDVRVRAQAVRAIGDVADPVLRQRRLDATRGDPELARRLAALVTAAADEDRDGRVRLEVIVALGRLRWAGFPGWLRRQSLVTGDPACLHAAMQSLRRSESWPEVLELLDEEEQSAPLRTIALRALAGRYEPAVVDGLIDRLRGESEPGRRREYADLLTRIHSKPGPRVYWGYRPAPRPPAIVAWERTEVIEETLDRVLADPDREVRAAILRRMQREKIAVGLATLARWLEDERHPGRVAAILDTLGQLRDAEAFDLLAAIVGDRRHAGGERLRALAMLAREDGRASGERLLEIAGSIEEGAVLVEALRRLGERPEVAGIPVLIRRLESTDPDVRAAAIDALAAVGAAEAREAVRRRLADGDARVRRAAAAAAGALGDREAVAMLLETVRDADAGLRSASLDSLRRLGERRAEPLALEALRHPETLAAGLAFVAELGGPEHAEVVGEVAGKIRSAGALIAAARAFSRWGNERALAELQGRSGVLLRWRVSGPLSPDEAARWRERLPRDADAAPEWPMRFAGGTAASVDPGPSGGTGGDAVRIAFSHAVVPEAAGVQFLASSAGSLRAWLNGDLVHERERPGPFRPDSDRFDATLSAGANCVVLEIAAGDDVRFHARFRHRSSRAELERLAQLALEGEGDPERGRAVFLDGEKAECIRCHRLGDQGGRVGPDLTGAGSRFSRVHLVESILEPGRAIAPSFETYAVVLRDGRVLAGVKLSETETALTFGDASGEIHELARSDVRRVIPADASLMPEGLETRLTAREFVDLIAFLVAEKDSP